MHMFRTATASGGPPQLPTATALQLVACIPTLPSPEQNSPSLKQVHVRLTLCTEAAAEHTPIRRAECYQA